MTLWASTDDGTSWQLSREIDRGMSGYSSLAVDDKGRLLLLYEQSDETEIVMTPDRFVFTVV